MRRDIRPVVAPTRDDGRRDERHAPVLGLQLEGIHVGRPHVDHALRREARPDEREAVVEAHAGRQHGGRDVVGLLEDGAELGEGLGGVVVAREEGAEVVEDGARGGFDAPGDEVREAAEDGLDDVGLAVEEGLALIRWETWEMLVSNKEVYKI